MREWSFVKLDLTAQQKMISISQSSYEFIWVQHWKDRKMSFAINSMIFMIFSLNLIESGFSSLPICQEIPQVKVKVRLFDYWQSIKLFDLEKLWITRNAVRRSLFGLPMFTPKWRRKMQIWSHLKIWVRWNFVWVLSWVESNRSEHSSLSISPGIIQRFLSWRKFLQTRKNKFDFIWSTYRYSLSRCFMEIVGEENYSWLCPWSWM